MASSSARVLQWGAATDLLLREQREPAHHLVDPRAVRRREVKMEARKTNQPAVNERRLVGAVAVEHEVNVEVGGDLTVDTVEA